MKRKRFIASLVCLACSAATAPPQSKLSINPGDYLYLPPSIADRVVFYEGFELPNFRPEINSIGAVISGSGHVTAAGFAGSGYQSSQSSKGEKPFAVTSSHLAVDRPLTVMRWWRVDTQMTETSAFQLMALLGRGHISCFIRGKGEWCALQRPTMFVQIDSIPSISNVNWAVKDNAYFQPSDWHHIAITVSNASEICFYLDGAPLATVHAKGRLFTANDINTLQASGSAELPMTTDELIVLDRVLSAQEIQQYCVSTRNLSERHYPALIPGSKAPDTRDAAR